MTYERVAGKLKKKSKKSSTCAAVDVFSFNEILLFRVHRERMRRIAESGTRRGANGRKTVQRRGHVQLRNRIPADRQGPEDVSRHRFVVRHRTVLQAEWSVKPNPSTDRSIASRNIVKKTTRAVF